MRFGIIVEEVGRSGMLVRKRRRGGTSGGVKYNISSGRDIFASERQVLASGAASDAVQTGNEERLDLISSDGGGFEAQKRVADKFLVSSDGGLIDKGRRRTATSPVSTRPEGAHAGTLHPRLLHTSTMWILPLVGYLGVVLGFGFLTLAIGTPAPSIRSMSAGSAVLTFSPPQHQDCTTSRSWSRSTPS